MKTIIPANRILQSLLLVLIYLITAVTVKAQTYTTIANGPWSSSSTWQGGSIPDATNIPSTAVINIGHIVTYNGADIINAGTVNIKNQTGLVPRLLVASGINFINNFGGKTYIKDGEYRQYRFTGGGETGSPQTGSFINAGGYVSVVNSYVEVANNWENKNSGTRIVNNSSVTTGQSYIQNSNGIDSILYSSISSGWQGSGDISVAGSFVYFQSARFQVASAAGNFRLTGCIASGDIDYITSKNHVTNANSAGVVEIKNSVSTTGINIDAYCTGSPALFITNGKATGTQTSDCSLNYFPAKLFASVTPGTLNFSLNPVLIAGVDKQVGAQYKYEGVAPGIDAYVKIDSIINGATVNMIDDNTNGSGFIEGFQPQINSGPDAGLSYAVFSFVNKITGTSITHNLATFTLTALDIDGTATLKEFDEIGMGAGSTAGYVMAAPGITLSEVSPGNFRGINANGVTINGVDTTAKEHMFSVSNTNVGTFTVKFGLQNSNASVNLRLFSVYFKGFVYPNFTPVPVKMQSFTATLNDDQKTVSLKWITATEINVSHFVVEKSTDGQVYDQAGLVFANGNEAEKTSYAFPDALTDNKAVIIYYRIRSVDNDGKGKYSDTRIIRLNKQEENSISILTYPNPVTNELRITIPANWQNKPVIYEVYSANGHLSKKSLNSNSSQTETLNVSNLAPGFYIVRATCNGETAQQKIIKH